VITIRSIKVMELEARSLLTTLITNHSKMLLMIERAILLDLHLPNIEIYSSLRLIQSLILVDKVQEMQTQDHSQTFVTMIFIIMHKVIKIQRCIVKISRRFRSLSEIFKMMMNSFVSCLNSRHLLKPRSLE